MNACFTRTALRLVFAAILAGLAPGVARAQGLVGEDEQSNLTPKKVYAKTVDEHMGVGMAWEPIFTPTNITCPNGGTCTVRVTLSLQTINVDPDESLTVHVRIDGVSMKGGVPLMARGSGVTPIGHATSFTWIRGGLPPGPHTVTVDAMTHADDESGVILAWHRTLIVEVLKP